MLYECRYNQNDAYNEFVKFGKTKIWSYWLKDIDSSNKNGIKALEYDGSFSYFRNITDSSCDVRSAI